MKPWERQLKGDLRRRYKMSHLVPLLSKKAPLCIGHGFNSCCIPVMTPVPWLPGTLSSCGGSRTSSGCGVQSPWKGPKSKHSCRSCMFTLEHTLMNPTATASTWNIQNISLLYQNLPKFSARAHELRTWAVGSLTGTLRCLRGRVFPLVAPLSSTMHSTYNMLKKMFNEWPLWTILEVDM